MRAAFIDGYFDRDNLTKPMSEDELDTWLDDAYRP